MHFLVGLALVTMVAAALLVCIVIVGGWGALP